MQIYIHSVLFNYIDSVSKLLYTNWEKINSV